MDETVDERRLFISDETIASTAKLFGIDYWTCGRHHWPVEEGIYCPDIACGFMGPPQVPLVLMLRSADSWRGICKRLMEALVLTYTNLRKVEEERDYLRKALDLMRHNDGSDG